MVVELAKAYIRKAIHGGKGVEFYKGETFDLERNYGILVCASKGWRKEGLED
jgi:hypothetical protein